MGIWDRERVEMVRLRMSAELTNEAGSLSAFCFMPTKNGTTQRLSKQCIRSIGNTQFCRQSILV